MTWGALDSSELIVADGRTFLDTSTTQYYLFLVSFRFSKRLQHFCEDSTDGDCDGGDDAGLISRPGLAPPPDLEFLLRFTRGSAAEQPIMYGFIWDG